MLFPVSFQESGTVWEVLPCTTGGDLQIDFSADISGMCRKCSVMWAVYILPWREPKTSAGS